MRANIFRLALATSALILTSCGGGSSGGGGSGDGNAGGGGGGGTTITFGGSADITLDELPLTQDPQEIGTVSGSSNASGDISFRLLSGKDSAFVSLNQGSLTLSFDRRPSFETPRDADGDNVYEFDVEAALGNVTEIRTYRVTVEDTVEGFSVTSIASGLGSNGTLQYHPQTDELLIVSGDGQISVVNASTSAITTGGSIALAADEAVIDVLVDPFLNDAQNFYALLQQGETLKLEFIETATGQRRALWNATIGTDNEASMGDQFGNLVVGIGDGRVPSAAQDDNDIRGSLISFTFGAFNNAAGNPTAMDVSTEIIARGVRSPILGRAPSGTPVVLDVGEQFNEATEFDVATGFPNFEWPFFDGTSAGPETGTPDGERLSPYATLAISGDDAGRWRSFLYLPGELMVADNLGNVFIVRDGFEEEVFRVENHRTDLRNAGLGNDPISSLDNGTGYPAFLLDADGDLFRVDRSF